MIGPPRLPLCLDLAGVLEDLDVGFLLELGFPNGSSSSSSESNTVTSSSDSESDLNEERKITEYLFTIIM